MTHKKSDYPDNVILMLDESRGTHIPKKFTENFTIGGDDGWQGITDEQVEILSDPHHDDYWEVWEEVLRDATYTPECGKVYNLYQDGSLFAVCYAEMTDEENQNMGFDL